MVPLRTPAPTNEAAADSPHVDDILQALAVVLRLLKDVGVPIASVTVGCTGAVQIRPRRLTDGAEAARRLGLASSMEHLHMTPPQREYAGVIDGLEVHVHSVHPPVGAP